MWGVEVGTVGDDGVGGGVVVARVGGVDGVGCGVRDGGGDWGGRVVGECDGGVHVGWGGGVVGMGGERRW